MQQNQQMLQQSLIALADTLKTVTGRIDEQAGASRKALADQRLLIEGMTEACGTCARSPTTPTSDCRRSRRSSNRSARQWHRSRRRRGRAAPDRSGG